MRPWNRRLTDRLIQPSDFAHRRRRLLDGMRPGSIALVPGAIEQRRNRDINFPFRQDSDFYYLTGFCEPDALLLLIPGRDQGEAIVFCRERDATSERRDGPVLGPDACQLALGVDDGFPISDVDEILPGLLEGRSQIYMNLGEHLLWDHRLMMYLEHLAKQRSADEPEVGEIVTLGHLLHEQRLVKHAKELELMAQAAQISVAAQYRALDLIFPGLTEADIEAELHYSYRLQGAKSEAYPSIVATGENACTLHYVKNESVLLEQELVLIDAGCELQYYASDVTRTYPVSGRFSSAQRDVYDIVLAANRAAIEACRPGNHFNLPHEAATLILVEGLIELGLLQGDPEQVIAEGEHDKFCPHKTSHWLGLDVHDVGDYRLGEAWRDLMPGMVLTVEPGIYIPRDDSTADIPEPYRGLGIRIEDAVLIQKEGCQVLTAALIKDADDIEARMAARAGNTDMSRVVA